MLSKKYLTIVDKVLRHFAGHPVLYYYSIFNIFGVQVFRYIWLRLVSNIRHMLYSPNSLEDYLVVRNDGIASRENYLDENTHEKLSVAFNFLANINHDVLKQNGVLSTSNSQVTRININKKCRIIYPEAQFIYECFLVDEKINKFGSDVVGYKLKTEPYIEIESFNVPEGQTDIFNASQGFHIDRIQDCVKLMYFMDDVKREDGAFEYIKGSHKGSFRKFVYLVAETYRITFYYVRNGLSKNAAVMELGPGRQKFLDKFMETDSYPVTSKSRTLSFSNHAGFHRRGKLESGHSRKIVWFHFYQEYPSFFWARVHSKFKKITRNNK
jgi:hypothetical protein